MTKRETKDDKSTRENLADDIRKVVSNAGCRIDPEWLSGVEIKKPSKGLEGLGS